MVCSSRSWTICLLLGEPLLKRPANCEAEGARGFGVWAGRAKSVHGALIGGLIGEESAVHQRARGNVGVQAQGIVRPIDAEWRVDDRQDDLQLQTGRCPPLRIRAGSELQLFLEVSTRKFLLQLLQALLGQL